MSEACTEALRAERRRLSHLLHGGIVQQITALSLTQRLWTAVNCSTGCWKVRMHER
jgi:signal transduction histidine kinase